MTTSRKKSKLAKIKGDAEAHGGIGDYEATVETPADQQIAALQESLTGERDKRKEERFGWIFLSSLLGLVLVLPTLPAVSSVVVILLYLGALLVCARRCGMDDVVVVLSNIWAFVVRGKKD